MFALLMKISRRTSDALIDFVFPLSRRAERVRAFTQDAIQADARTHEALDLRITTLARYHDSTIEDTIRALKYEKSVHAARLLAQLLADYLVDAASELEAFSDREVVVIPIPLAPKRNRERGYNQIEFVLQQAPIQESGLRVRSDLLQRTRETAAQTRLSRSERLSNIKGAFAIAPGADLHDLHVFLIDDVTTTGATLHEATRVLQKAGATVTPLAFAHA